MQPNVIIFYQLLLSHQGIVTGHQISLYGFWSELVNSVTVFKTVYFFFAELSYPHGHLEQAVLESSGHCLTRVSG